MVGREPVRGSHDLRVHADGEARRLVALERDREPALLESWHDEGTEAIGREPANVVRQAVAFSIARRSRMTRSQL